MPCSLPESILGNDQLSFSTKNPVFGSIYHLVFLICIISVGTHVSLSFWKSAAQFLTVVNDTLSNSLMLSLSLIVYGLSGQSLA